MKDGNKMTITIPLIYINLFIWIWCLGAGVTVIFRHIGKRVVDYCWYEDRVEQQY